MPSQMESYLVELHPYFALVGSDANDRNDIIHQEYSKRILAAGTEVDFHVIWCSIRSKKRNTMMKCIASTQSNREVIISAFQRVHQATVTAFYPTMNRYTVYPMDGATGPAAEGNLTTIIMSQRTYEEEMTRVALTGLNKIDPHSFRPTDNDGKQSEQTIMEKILLVSNRSMMVLWNTAQSRKLQRIRHYPDATLLPPKQTPSYRTYQSSGNKILSANEVHSLISFPKTTDRNK